MAQITGKFIKKLSTEEGMSERGRWVRCSFEVLTLDAPNKMVAFTLLGEERIAMLEGVNVGDVLVVEYSPESREFNEKVYTDLRCYRIMRTTWAKEVNA